MLGRLLEDAEVREAEPLGASPFDLVERRRPRLQVDVRRRRHREEVSARRDPDTRRVSRVARAVGGEVAHMVDGMTRRRERLHSEHALPDDVDVFGRYRRELPPELVELVAPDPARAPLEPARIDDVRRTDLTDVHLEARVPADESTRRTGVIEMDVREDEVPDVTELEAVLREPPLESVDARGWPAVDESGGVAGQEKGPDRTRDAEVSQVDEDCVAHE